MPIDPRQFALTPEGRKAERFADLERLATRADSTSLNRITSFTRVTAGAGQTCASLATVQVSFDTEILDTADSWAASDPANLTATVAGVYVAQGYITDSGTSFNSRTLSLLTTGGIGSAVYRDTAHGAGAHELSVTGIFVMDVGDTLAMFFSQDSGVTVTIAVAHLSWACVGPP